MTPAVKPGELVTIVENVPPRAPNDDDEDEEDEEDEDRHEEPAKYDTRRLGGGNKAQRFRRAELTGSRRGTLSRIEYGKLKRNHA